MTETESNNLEYKWNWKKELKKSFAGFLKELFSLACIMITVILLFFTQSEKQIQTIGVVFNEGNPVFLALALIGLIAVSAVVEKIIKIIFWLIKTPVMFFIRKHKRA